MSRTPPPLLYEQRLLLYADIVGWSRLVEAENDEEKRRLIEYVIHKLRYELAFDRLPGVSSTTGWQFSLASDSLFASCPVGSEYFRDLLLAMCVFAHGLLKKGIYLRGALVAGSMLHEQEVVVGPAVVTAVDLERSTRHPRIAIHESAFHHLREHLGPEDQWVYSGPDGVPALDYIAFMYSQGSFSQDALGRDAQEILLVVHRKMETDRLNESYMEKHQWMQGYLEYLAASDVATTG